MKSINFYQSTMETKSYGVKTVRDGQTGIEKENKWIEI